MNLSHPGTPGLRCSAPSWGLIVGHPLMPFSQATAGMPGTDAARKPQHARQLDVNLFSDVKKLRLRDRNLTSEKILTCYRPDPARRAGPPPALRLHKLNAIGSSVIVGQKRLHLTRMTHDHENAWIAGRENRAKMGRFARAWLTFPTFGPRSLPPGIRTGLPAAPGNADRASHGPQERRPGSPMQITARSACADMRFAGNWDALRG